MSSSVISLTGVTVKGASSQLLSETVFAPKMDSLVVVVRLPPGESAAPSSDAVAPTDAQSPQTSSADEEDASERDGEAPPEVTKKRKPTYEARKEEIVTKQAEVVALREELHRLKVEQLRRREPLAANAALRNVVAHNHAVLASAQSLISNYGADYETPPMSTSIHLPMDPIQRQQIMNDLKPQKMQEALAFMVARSLFTDLNRTSRQLEDFEATTGDNVLVHWEVARITEKDASVKSVYDEMMYFKATQEMTLAEKMGIVSVRESDSCEEFTGTTQMRIVTTRPNGLEVEKNIVLYSQYFATSPFLNQPHAVLITDYVDQDDAFPYQPESRIRKDVSSATLVVQCPSVPTKAPAVAVVKWTFLRIHSSPLASPEEREAISREGVRGYFDLMLASVRERLAWRNAAEQ